MPSLGIMASAKLATASFEDILQVQRSAIANQTGSSFSTTALGATPTDGNKLIVGVGRRSSGTFATVCTTPSGFTLLRTHINTANAGYCGVSIFCKEASGDGTQFTIAGVGGVTDAYAAEYSGLEDADVADEVQSADSGTGFDNPFSTGTTGTTDQAAELLIAAWVVGGGSSGAWTITAPFTEQDDEQISGWADQIVAATGAYAAEASQATGSRYKAAAIVALRAKAL